MDQRHKQPVARPAKHYKAGSSDRDAVAGSDTRQSDMLHASDPCCTPQAARHTQSVKATPAATPGTPQECATMVDAVEEAIKDAQDVTPESGGTASRLANLQAWLAASGVQVPTPAAKDLNSLAAAAADNQRLRKQLEALREAELELAAREAEENAQNFAMLEEENLSLAADNAQLQQQLAELQARTQAAQAAQAAGLAKEQWVDGVQARAVVALQRAADTRRLSGVFEEQQLASFRQLDEAEEQLSAVQAQRPGSSHSQQAAMQQRLLHAEQGVQTAAAAAQEASQKLQLVLEEKEKVQQELHEIKQQLEAQPLAQRHNDLYQKLVEAHQQLQDEKQQHQRLTGSLLEHAGRLSHKYYMLSDEYGTLQQRYHHLAAANEQLAHQLKEAHEALYDLQVAVQATPPAKRREQQHLLARVEGAEQAVNSLAQEKSQLQERLLQAHAFIACLQQRAGGSIAHSQQQAAGQDTPVGRGGLIMGSTTQQGPTPPAAATKVVSAPGAAEATAAAAGAAAAGAFGGFITPVKGCRNPLFDLPATPGSDLHAASAPAAVGAVAHAASFLAEPVSPILAAATAALSACAGQQQQQHLQLSAASQELHVVQQEQLGLREEISKAKSALADIAGQLRASIGVSASAMPGVAALPAGSSGSVAQSAAFGRCSKALGMQDIGIRATGSAASRSRSSSSGSSSQVSSGASSNGRGSSGPRGKPPAVLPAAKPGSSAGTGEKRAKAVPATHSKKGAPDDQVPEGRAPPAAATTISMPESQSRSAANTTQVLQARPGSAGREFSFPSLGEVAGEQPLLLSTVTGSGGAVAAAQDASSPCESVGSINSANTSRTNASQHRQQLGAASGQPAASLPGIAQQQQVSMAISSTSCSQSRNQAALPPASSDSKAKGSISLDQLIADAESVSLEYGMSPCKRVLEDTATTYSAGRQQSPELQPFTAAAPQSTAQRSQQQQDQPTHTPCSIAGSSGELFAAAGAGWQQQQQDNMFERLASCMADSPGSASSSAGGAAAARQWLQQQQLAAVGGAAAFGAAGAAGTPGPVPGEFAGVADMQSAAKPVPTNNRSSAGANAAYNCSPLQLQLAATPAGAEGVASNILLQQQEVVFESSPLDGRSQQQQSLLTPSFATPTIIAAQRAAAAALLRAQDSQAVEDDATSGKQQCEGQGGASHGNEGLMPLQWMPTSPAATRSAGKSAAPAAVGSAGADCASCKQEQTAQSAAADPDAAVLPPTATPDLSTPAATNTSRQAAAAGCADDEPSPLQFAAAALLASISPAGLISPGEVVPAQALKYMTPEWMRELRQRCQQGTVQVQQLRRDLGLATPETAAPGHGQTQGPVAIAGEHAAARSDVAPVADAAAPAEAATAEGTSSRQPNERAAASAASRGRARLLETATPASNGSMIGHVNPLSQASSRSNIDKLRRRAIAQAAAAAAAASDTGGSDAGGSSAANSRCESPAELGALVAAVAAAESARDLDRSDSAGSLAQYMLQTEQQQQHQLDTARSGSSHFNQMTNRPEAPTPGSCYSDTSGCCSPDVLLAGLNNSRSIARQLQLQLQRQLERTTSMPAIGARRISSDDGTAAVVDGLGAAAVGFHHHASSWVGAAAVTGEEGAGDDEGAAGQGGSDAGSDYGVTPVKGSPRSRGSSCSQPAAAGLVRQPITPGAALNAGAESRLLSPTQPLSLVFNDGEGEAHNTAEGQPSCSTSTAMQGGAGPTAGGGAAMTGGGAANSVKAHQLSGLPAGTFTATTHGAGNLTPASDARGALQEPATTGTAALSAAALLPWRYDSADPSLSSWADAAGAVARQAEAAASSSAAAQTCRVEPKCINLGDSPTSTRRADQRSNQGSSSGSRVFSQVDSVSSGSCSYSGVGAPSHSMVQGGSRAINSAATPTSAANAFVGLGDSPESCCNDQQHAVHDGGSDSSRSEQQMSAAGSVGAMSKGLLGSSVVTPDLPAQQSNSQKTAALAAPAGSSVTAGSSSTCMFATPAVAFDTPNSRSIGPGTGDQAFYTGLQHTARSTMSASATTRQAAVGAQVAFKGFGEDASPAAAGASAAPGTGDVGVAAAAGTCDSSAQDDVLQQLLASPANSSCSSAADSPNSAAAAPTNSSSGRSAPQVEHPTSACTTSSAAGAAGAWCIADIASHPVSITVTPAGSTSCSDCRGTNSAGGGGKAVQMPHSMQTAGTGLPVAAAEGTAVHQGSKVGNASCENSVSSSSRGSQTGRLAGTPGAVADMPAAQQMVSPTFSDLGFVDAPISADYDLAQQLQQQQQSSPGSDEVAGGIMTFEQRLALLCSEEEEEQSAHCTSQQQQETAAGLALQGMNSPCGRGLEGLAAEQREVHTPQLPDHLANRATQTSPLAAIVDAATQKPWAARDIETQVTPALHSQHRSSSSSRSRFKASDMQQQMSVADGSTGVVVGASGQGWNVTGSPVEVRDQM